MKQSCNFIFYSITRQLYTFCLVCLLTNSSFAQNTIPLDAPVAPVTDKRSRAFPIYQAQPTDFIGKMPQTRESNVDIPDIPGAEGLDAPAQDALSLYDEQKVGQSIFNDMRNDPDYYLDDPLLIEYLNDIASHLVSQNRSTARLSGKVLLFPVRDKNFNAFALPGGYIGINTGLILASNDEAELASVIAHEIGHVKQRHLAQMLARQGVDNLINISALILGALASSQNPEAGSAVMMSGQALAASRYLKFSNKAEQEADRIGYNLLQESQYSTSGMLRMMQKMEQISKIDRMEVDTYFSTHPLTGNRIAEVQNRLRSILAPNNPHYAKPSTRFLFVQTRARVLQANSDFERIALEKDFSAEIKQMGDKSLGYLASRYYGIALSQALRNKTTESFQAVSKASEALGKTAPSSLTLYLDLLQAKLIQMTASPSEKLAFAHKLGARYFSHASSLYTRIELLRSAGDHQGVVNVIEDQFRDPRSKQSTTLWQAKARAHAELNQRTLQHWAYGEYFSLLGQWEQAVEQMRLAQEAYDGGKIAMAQVATRQREIKGLAVEHRKEQENLPF